MTNLILLVVLVGTIAVLSTEISSVKAFECHMCDNQHGSGACDKNSSAMANQVMCDGVACSVTAYVRYTAAGCQCSSSTLLVPVPSGPKSDTF